MDIVGTMLVVAMADRHINIFDVRKFSEPIQKRESSLRYQTRTVACMSDGQGRWFGSFLFRILVSLTPSLTGYATSSVEGRIAVEYFDASPEAQGKKYAFKCHRQAIDGVDHVWPVNALVFHPRFVFPHDYEYFSRTNTETDTTPSLRVVQTELFACGTILPRRGFANIQSILPLSLLLRSVQTATGLRLVQATCGMTVRTLRR